MRALWRYDNGDLVQYEMRAGGRLRTAQLMRDPIGRVVRATIDGAAHAFAYDAAGQRVGADTPLGSYEFGYDADGRLARVSSPSRVAECEYDAAGQLVGRTSAGALVTRFEYDGGGRRVRESGGGLERRYRWDELGRLAEVVTSDDGEDARAIDVVVDALGELASVDGTPLLWDSAHPLRPLAWNGEASVLGEDGPWALAGRDGARWLAPDWQGTVGDGPRDPWGAPAAPGAGGAGIRLGFRGELEIGTDTWLRNRVYQPGSRAFLQPDPLPALPGSATAANPYHYAANNAITLSDPLGLHPLSERELKAYRDGLNRGLLDGLADLPKDMVNSELDAVKDVGKFIYENPGTAGTMLGAGALALATGPIAIGLGAAAVGLGFAGARNSIRDKDWRGLGLDVLSIAPGVGGVVKGGKALIAAGSATRFAGRARTAATAADDAARSGATAAGKWDPHRLNWAVNQGKSLQQAERSHVLEQQGRRFDEIGIGIGIGGVSAVRTYLPKIGIDHPLLTAPASLLMNLPASIGPAR
jgi:RHS repeat-associated protein